MTMPMIISFYTPDNEYREWSEILRASCEKFGLDHEINEVDLSRLGSWHARAAYKGVYMFEAAKRHDPRPVLWLDADSEIVGPLNLFDDPPFDFAVSRPHNDRLRTGTVYANRAARRLLRIAATFCNVHPGKAHERNLQAALRLVRVPACRSIRVRFLDYGYNYVPNWPTPPGWNGKIFILSNHTSGSGYLRSTQHDGGPKGIAGRLKLKTLVTSFWSDLEGSFYKQAARVLQKKCGALGIEYDIRPRPPRANWLRNCNMKPSHILEVLEQRKRPVLWVDADSNLVSVPVAVDALDCDVGGVPFEGSPRNDPPLRVRAFVIYFNYTPAALDFVRSWKAKCDASTSEDISDHQYLEQTWREFEATRPDCRFAHLPETYACTRKTAGSVILFGPGSGTTRTEGNRRCLKRALRLTSDTVFGYFSRAQRAFYDRMVAEAPDPAVFIEVGCLLGKSTIYLAQAIQAVRSYAGSPGTGKFIQIHAVDWFKGSDEPAFRTEPALQGIDFKTEFLRNIMSANVHKVVRTHTGESTAVARTFAPASADMVFIDGSHDYESVKRDILAWRSVVKPGGVLAGDDYHSPRWASVVKAVDELLPGRKIEGTIWTWKVPAKEEVPA